jgi:hypothetical protein
MSEWPLPSVRDVPPDEAERYQSLIWYFESVDIMLGYYATLQEETYSSRGFDPVKAEQSPTISGLVASQTTPWENAASFALFHFWLGALYVVIEGWYATLLVDEKIDALLTNDEFRAKLKRVRHAMFHYHASFRHPQFMEFYQQIRQVGPWAVELHNAFEAFFLANPTRPATSRKPSVATDAGVANAHRRLVEATERLYDVLMSPESNAEQIRQQIELHAKACQGWKGPPSGAPGTHPA